MNTEYGIFNDEGCIEAGFYEREEAEKRLRGYSADPGADGFWVREICPDHEDQPRACCEECASEEDETETNNEEDDDDV